MLEYRYVLGFLFDDRRSKVWLMNKERPSWQKGKLNGIGGHIEDGETPEECMRREFHEETGVHIFDWEHAVTLHCQKVEMFIFRAFSDMEHFNAVRQTTDERPQCFFVHAVNTQYHPVIPNLDWMVPLILDSDLRTPIDIADDFMPGD